VLLFVYYQKNKSNLKIGFVSDWEYPQTKNTDIEKSNLTKKFLLKTVFHYNYIFKPDLVIGGGDYLKKSKKNEPINLKQLTEVLSIFEKIKAVKKYYLGKEDCRMDCSPKIKELLKLENRYYSQIFKDIKVLILDTTETTEEQGIISQSQLNWIKEELLEPEPVIIFSYDSLIETPVGDTWRKNIINQEEILSIIKNNNEKIIAIFSGNTGKDYVTKKSGVPFINISGLTSKFSLGRFSDIEITRDKKIPNSFWINLENHGKNGSTYKIKRDLKTKTATRITLEEKKQTELRQDWFDLDSEQAPEGVLNEGVGGEPNIGVTENGTVVAAFENKEQSSKIQVKIFKNEKWLNLSDTNYSEGLISLGKGSNPNIETRGEDIFVVFTESDYDERIRLLQWSDSKQKWNELSEKGFLSEKSGHEPTLVFDKKKENLFIAFAEQIKQSSKQTQAKIKRWDGNKWKTITESLLVFADWSSSSVDEFDLVSSKVDESIYITYEEIKTSGDHTIRIKKWNGTKWNNLTIDKLYLEKISKINGFSPSIALTDNDTLFLSFVENNRGPLHIYQYNENSWQDIGFEFEESTNPVIEPFIETDEKNNLFLAYSEKKSNIVMALANGKNTGEELIKTSAWRIRVQKFKDDSWTDCKDDLNPLGFISKGSGKGDPALKSFKNDLLLITSDEENDYAARVKKYTIN